MYRPRRADTVAAIVAVLGCGTSSFVTAFDKNHICVMRLSFDNKANARKRADYCWLTEVALISA